MDEQDHVDVNAREFSKMLLIKRAKNSEWNEIHRTLALNIHYKSASTYNYLSNTLNFKLPSQSSIYRWTPVKHLSPGFNDISLNALKQLTNNIDEKAREIVLVFDAIHIRKELAYNEYHDRVEGYVDLGDSRKAELATEVTLFMARSLFGKWKYNLSYFASKNAITGSNLQILISKNLDILKKLGFRVRAVISDQGSPNRSAYKKFGVTHDQPYTIYNDEKIYMLFDPCHLIKNVRNTLMRNDIDTDDGRVSWGVIRELFKYESNKTTRMCPKLSERHINTNDFDKQKVRFATQVLSHSCSAAIKTLNEIDPQIFGKYSSNALPTANFLEKMDKTFDSLNSKVLFDPRKPHRSALKIDNVPFTYLMEIKEYIQNMKPAVNVFCIKGLIQTINGVIGLSLDLFGSDLKIEFFLTSKINQDPIENMFALIRARGGFNRNPSLKELNFLMARIISMKIISGPQLSTNCENDNDEHVQTALNELIEYSKTQEQSDTNSQGAGEYIISKYFDNEENKDQNAGEISNDSNTNDIQDVSIRYFCGYVVRKLLKQNNCSLCSDILQKNTSSMNEKSELLIFHKNYYVGSDFGSLIPPSDLFYQICHLHVEIFSKVFKSHPESTGICQLIVKLCIDETNKHDIFKDWFEEGNCLHHREAALNILIKVLIYKNCQWLNNKAAIETQNKKLQIFKHNQKKSGDLSKLE